MAMSADNWTLGTEVRLIADRGNRKGSDEQA